MNDLRAAPIVEQFPKEAHDKCTNTHIFVYSQQMIPIQNRSHRAFDQQTNPLRKNFHSPVCQCLKINQN